METHFKNHASEANAGSLANMRLTRRGRIVLFALAALIVCASVLFTSTAVASDPDPGVEVTTTTVTEGETLWHLAKGVAQPGEDLRDVVAVIQDLNGLTTSQVQAGQQLLLPIN